MNLKNYSVYALITKQSFSSTTDKPLIHSPTSNKVPLVHIKMQQLSTFKKLRHTISRFSYAHKENFSLFSISTVHDRVWWRWVPTQKSFSSVHKYTATADTTCTHCVVWSVYNANHHLELNWAETVRQLWKPVQLGFCRATV